MNNYLYQQDLKCILNFEFDWTVLKNKSILITGASGQIGTVLIDLFRLLDAEFKLNIHLILIARNVPTESKNINEEWISHDISNPISLSQKIDFVIHAASNTHPIQYSKYPVETISTNVFGTFNLLNLCKMNKPSRFVLLSSVEIYGEGEKKFTETDFGYIDCNVARNGYNESKRLCESLCQSYKMEYSQDFVTARLCRIYGPTLRKDDSKAMSQFIRNGIERKDIVLKSSGNQFYSYLYSIDAAIAILWIMLKGESGEAYNIADLKSNCHLKDLAELIAKKSETKVIYEIPSEQENKGFSKVQNAILDSSKLKRLGWKSFFDIDKGIDHTLRIMGEL